MNFGEILKNLRIDRNETLHKVSMGTDIDVTLLSKFERNIRFPTNIQINRIAKYFNISSIELSAIVVSNKIVNEYGINDVTSKAIILVSEQIASYSPHPKKNKK